ncbi:unnamed protein product [Fusarium equiseti]|uniref:AAA+ ATPase domain-containing protein n=1 Tax=Fusarium equiseti TaxID=61235 RepID=A0A8J2NE32_FUSEQ|nr:unnamed protein product [Fusarium equiseti]
MFKVTRSRIVSRVLGPPSEEGANEQKNVTGQPPSEYYDSDQDIVHDAPEFYSPRDVANTQNDDKGEEAQETSDDESSSWKESRTVRPKGRPQGPSGSEIDPRGLEKPLDSGPDWEFTRHFTISRDQTRASSSGEEKLAALLREQNSKDQDPLAKQAGIRQLTTPHPRPFEPPRRPSTRVSHSVFNSYSYQKTEKRPIMGSREQKADPTGRSSAQPYTTLTLPVPDNNQDAGSERETSSSQTPASYSKIAQLEEEIHKLRRAITPPIWKRPLGPNEHKYLEQRPESAFVVYKYYEPSFQAKDVSEADHNGTAMPDPKAVREVVRALSGQMVAALDAFVDSHPTFKDKFPDWRSDDRIDSPFLFWYCYRASTNLDDMDKPHRKQMQLLTRWIDHNYNDTYAEVDGKFSQSRISEMLMPFFIQPGDVVVSRNGKSIHGYIAASWATKGSSKSTPSPHPNGPRSISQSWKIDVWCYGYDGRFYINSEQITITLKFDEDDPDFNIEDLNTMPIRFVTSGSQRILERRGRTMWGCRKRNLITYYGTGADDLACEGERYMIDFDTYKQLHSDSAKFKTTYAALIDPKRREMDAALFESDEILERSRLFVFPSTIAGYNLRQKKWHDLQVDCIQPVHWNKQAFRHLVIDEEIKDIIQALVTSKLATDNTTDFIQGKGSGLIILLHGGPGTGKTFTAESVAEIAEKPLFRVTCGDIGTKPEQVEKYLESVLHLGKIWGCVVLLDEADVFLEQRTLTDLERNALVSVFLRVLEYYEGILILTSNRVGTFDEAFKSRIQLSLHYESLTKSQRRTIWANFLKRLNGLEQEEKVVQPITDRKRKLQENPGIDFDDIERHLADLAEEQMNGRQIRNAITTARQLAKFKNESMTYRHLEHVIKISRKFDKYLERVRDSYTDDQVAREEGIR